MGVQNLLSNVVELLLDTVFVVDMEGVVLFANPACEQLLGYRPDEMIGKTLFDLVAPEDQARTRHEAQLVMSGTPRIGFENRYVHKGGHLVDIMWSARLDKERGLRIAVARDVSEKRRAESVRLALYDITVASQNAESLESLFQEVHRISGRLMSIDAFAVLEVNQHDRQLECIYGTEKSGNALFMSDAHAESICHEALRGQQTVLASGPASWLAAPVMTQGNASAAANAVLLLKSARGVVYTSNDRELLQFISAQLATAMERRRLLEELTRSARYDDLTGLPNRRLFYDRLEGALAHCRRQLEQAAILYLDINDFKDINDAHGHVVGDDVLQATAFRMRQAVREEDTVARLGGDEFIVLLPTVRGVEDAQRVANKIRRVIGRPLLIGDLTLTLQVSIGIALYPDNGVDAGYLVRHADQAMYREKQNTQ
jgi:diguanylate cyclase (GGDEF)-like protein/PAS domain S-box-containing protein